MITHRCRAWPKGCGQYRDEARWSGARAGHCTICGELFLTDRAFTLHIVAGTGTCRSPGDLRKRNGEPQLERVTRPGWVPAHAWREHRPDLTHWNGPGAVEGDNLTAPGAGGRADAREGLTGPYTPADPTDTQDRS